MLDKATTNAIHRNEDHSTSFEKNDDNYNLKNTLHKSILNKLQISNFYENLLQLTPTKYESMQMEEILVDERNHLQVLKGYFSKVADYKFDDNTEYDAIIYRTYRDGLRKAYDLELAAYKNYRDVYMQIQNKEIKDNFFKIMTDELTHANRFMFLYFRDKL